MPTNEAYTNEALIHVTWTSPLTPDELAACFEHLVQQMNDSEQQVDVIFDLTQAGHIPVDAPHLAYKAGFLRHNMLSTIAVIGMSRWARMLANIATGKTNKKIEGYHSLEDAVEALNSK